MSLAFGVVFLCVGLFSCYLLLYLLSLKLRVASALLLSFAIYMSIVSIIGYLLYRIHISFKEWMFFVPFLLLMMTEISFIRIRHIRIELSKIDISTIMPIILFIFSFILYLYPSLPSLFPVAWEVDSATHFNIINHIWEDKTLFTDATYYAFGSGYPFSMHLNISLLSWVLDINPIHITYPFLCVISAMALMAVFEISVSLSKKWYIPLLSSLFVLTSIFPYEVLVRGFWAAEFGILLCLIFAIMLKESEKISSTSKIILLALLGMNIIMTYTFWTFIPICTFFLFMIISRKKRISDMIIFTIMILVPSCDYYFSYFYPVHKQTIAWLGSSGGTTQITILTIGPTLLILSTFGIIYLIRLREKIFMSLFLACVLQIAALIVGKYTLGFGYYYYAKNFYLFIYILSVAAGIGSEYFSSIVERRIGVSFKKAWVAFFLSALFLLQIANLSYYSNLQYSLFNTQPVMTPEQYEVALWTKENLPEGDLAYVANPPTSYWFYAISGHYLKTKEQEWWIKPALDFDQWLSNAKLGETIVILDLERFWNFSTRQTEYNGFFKIGEKNIVGQSFVTENSKIDNININAYKVGSPKKLILTFLSNREIIGTSEISLEKIKEKKWTRINFKLDMPIYYDTKYYFTIRVDGGNKNNYVYIAASSGDKYKNGEAYISKEGELNDWDLYFLVSPKFEIEKENIIYRGHTLKIKYRNGDNYVLQLENSPISISVVKNKR